MLFINDLFKHLWLEIRFSLLNNLYRLSTKVDEFQYIVSDLLLELSCLLMNVFLVSSWETFVNLTLVLDTPGKHSFIFLMFMIIIFWNYYIYFQTNRPFTRFHIYEKIVPCVPNFLIVVQNRPFHSKYNFTRTGTFLTFFQNFYHHLSPL